MSDTRSTKLDDGTEPVALGARTVGLLEGHGWRKSANDQWTSPAGVRATLGYGSGSYRLRFYPAGPKSRPAEVLDLSRASHATRVLDAVERWDTWPDCGAPLPPEVAA